MHRPIALTSLALLVLVSPVVTWWLVGDLSEPFPPADLSYTVRAPEMSAAAERSMGVIAATIVLVAGAVAAITWRRGVLRTNEVLAAVPLVVTGIYAGSAARAVTSGVVGANIGAGLVMLFTGPFLIVTIGSAIALWTSGTRRRPATRQISWPDRSTR